MAAVTSFSMKVKILNIAVDKTSKKAVVDRVRVFLEEKRKFLLVTPNPEIALLAYKDVKLAEIINSADIAIADGVGFKLASPSLAIIKGRELMLDLFGLADRLKLKIYLLGAADSVNKLAVKLVIKKYANVKVLGASGPKLDFFSVPTNGEEKKIEEAIVSEINKFRPDILFVAFGAPKQELWAAGWLPKLKVGGAMAVGGAFDYFAGNAKVPKIIEKLGLEWLFRLINEPRRLGRMFNAVVVFPLMLLKHKFFRA
ncbi:hypothetical protein A2125_01875 [Candidatus Woesebacteria bacterium GWB1_43_5]|uniref:Glycosyltransferase n=1 Tax=Candidatus Woesebacteria bacterium GWB1_43_5 TaxID=1802474 RepID=A0A1F7WV65_9BACT|nr:MAG: hypothetical protein A2125_01875 [Candidatus Woesebacteria bacterium GWB1_43_5]